MLLFYFWFLIFESKVNKVSISISLSLLSLLIPFFYLINTICFGKFRLIGDQFHFQIHTHDHQFTQFFSQLLLVVHKGWFWNTHLENCQINNLDGVTYKVFFKKWFSFNSFFQLETCLELGLITCLDGISIV